MGERGKTKQIAIACQGGGSHAAFTAGVLKCLLGSLATKEQDKEYEIVALSGTSGGALCALLAWYALLEQDMQKAAERATEMLDSFWLEDNAARSLDEGLLNESVYWSNRLAEATFGVPASSPYYLPRYPFYPYNMFSPAYWQERLKSTIEKHVDFAGLEDRQPFPEEPMLFVGAVDAITGEFHVFKSHKKREGDGSPVFNDEEGDRISADGVLASTAVPFLFEAVRTGEVARWDGSQDPPTRFDEGVYWDGLYSQNPPIRDLTDAEPDEIWVIQINPEEIDEEPKMTAKISDRRNELAGNLSLNQELYFVRKMNELVREWGQQEDGGTQRLAGPKGKEYRPIKVRRIELSRPLHTSSKLDRSPFFIRDMMDHGDEKAAHFLETMRFQSRFEAAWEKGDMDSILRLFAKDAVIRLVPPSPLPVHEYTGEKVRGAVEWCLTNGFTLQQSRDYRVNGDKRTCWMLLTSDRFRGPVKGRAEMIIRDDEIQAFTFYPLGPLAKELREVMKSGDREAVSG